MAVILFTGFDLTDDADQFPFLTSNSGLSTVATTLTRYNYGRCLSISTATPGNIDLGSAYDEVIVEFDMRFDTIETGAGTPAGAMIQFMDEDGNGIGAICQSSSSGANVNIQWRDWGGTIRGSASTGYPLPQSTWFHIGIRVKVHATLGEIEVWTDASGSQVKILDVTGVDTEYIGGKTIQYVNGRRALFSGSFRLDNFIAMDLTGAKDNTFKGPSRVYFGNPASDGDLTDFAPNASTNVSQVDENPPDEDSTFNESSTSGHKDCFNFPTWTGVIDGGLDIAAVAVTALARKTDASAISLAAMGRKSAVSYEGTAVPLKDSFTVRADSDFPLEIWTEDPATASDWDLAALNAFQWGYAIP